MNSDTLQTLLLQIIETQQEMIYEAEVRYWMLFATISIASMIIAWSIGDIRSSLKKNKVMVYKYKYIEDGSLDYINYLGSHGWLVVSKDSVGWLLVHSFENRSIVTGKP